MATLYTLLKALRDQVAIATTGLTSTSEDTPGRPINVEVGLYWPSAKALQNNVRAIDNSTGNLTALVTVYDRGMASDSTRWGSQIVGTSLVPPTLTITLNGTVIEGLSPDPQIDPFGTATLVFNGPITPGDAAAIILAESLLGTAAIVVIAGASDTPQTLAAQAVTLLTASATLSQWVTAAATGNTLTITSKLTGFLALKVNIGNGGIETIEIARRKRHLQVIVWARTPMDRDTVSDPIEAMVAGLEYNYGLTFPDGTMGRLTYMGDVETDAATLSDTMRRDFLVCLDYPITTQDQVYTVLAPLFDVTQLPP